MTAFVTATLPKLNGLEVSPGIVLIGEPTPIAGSNLMRCLADVGGALCLIEISLKFGTPQDMAKHGAPPR